MSDDAFNRALRKFLFGLMALGAAVALPSAGAHAQAKEVVLVNWGGDAVKFMADAFGAPFEKETGIKVVVDSSGPSLAKIKAMDTENAAKPVFLDDAWYADNYSEVYNRFLDLISS